MTEAEKSGSNTISANEMLEDKQSRLADLTARAAAKDAIKDYNAATELYSQATELQAELNGELSIENADLLFAYGKSLYNVAVSKSDVLGSKVAGETQAQPKGASTGNVNSAGSTSTGDNLIKNAMSSGLRKKSAEEGEKSQSEIAPNKPFFQFTGDDNFDDSESEEGDDNDKAGGGDEEDEEDDDFANAFEVLDLARVLYLKKLSAAEEDQGKGKSTDIPSDIKHVKERLADTYDLQAEISLEAERFMDAVTDLKTTLELRQSLHPMADPSIAECHYKLSLALEFASVNKQEDEADEGKVHDKPTVDEVMRAEAITHMEKAIESCKLRMDQEQKKLDSGNDMDEDKVTATKKRIANVKEIVADMEQRLIDLRRPPVPIEEPARDNEAVLKGILGQIVGQSPAEQQLRLDAATKGANDLSAFVRRKPAAKQTSQDDSQNKRSAEEATIQDGEAKRARVDGAPSTS